MRRAACILILLTLLAVPVSAAQLVITQPSADEARIAELRDFYVYGIFSGTVTNPGNIRIELFKDNVAGGPPVRVIESHVDPVSGITNASVMNQSYCTLTGFCTRNNGAMVPDLVDSPGGIRNPANKLVITNRYYLGLVQGGATKGFETTYADSTGAPLADLNAGNYTIRVTGLSGSLAGQSVNETITVGLTRTALGRYTPAANKDALFLYAHEHDRHVYNDWFPGYFSDPDNSTVSFESPRRWTPNNGIEVVNDRTGTFIDTPAVADNALFVYNINSQSTTYGVELAGILRYGLADSPNTTFLHYDTGEPVMTYQDAGGEIRTIMGTPVPFPVGRRLVLYRAGILRPGTEGRENLYDPHDHTMPVILDRDMENGIIVPQGSGLILYGAVKPIPSAVTPTAIPYRFTIDNRIATVTSTIRNAAGVPVSTGIHEVNLSRLYTAGSPKRYTSQYEFGIEIRDLANPGRYTVSIAGIDSNGTPVPGADTLVSVTVVTPTAPSSLTGIGRYVRMQLVARPG